MNKVKQSDGIEGDWGKMYYFKWRWKEVTAGFSESIT